MLFFGLPLYFLDVGASAEQALIEPIWGFWPLDVIQYQFMLARGGQLSLGAHEPDTSTLIVVSLLDLATLFTQIIMVNMLIAIMCDSYAEVSENRNKLALANKLNILCN